jgi:hypothetical protein
MLLTCHHDYLVSLNLIIVLTDVYFHRLKINHDAHEFILESGTIANSAYVYNVLLPGVGMYFCHFSRAATWGGPVFLSYIISCYLGWACIFMYIMCCYLGWACIFLYRVLLSGVGLYIVPLCSKCYYLGWACLLCLCIAHAAI